MLEDVESCASGFIMPVGGAAGLDDLELDESARPTNLPNVLPKKLISLRLVVVCLVDVALVLVLVL